MKTVLEFSDGSRISLSDLQINEMRSYFSSGKRNYVSPVKDIKYFKEKVLHDLRSSSLTEGFIINRYRNHRKLIVSAINELINDGLIGCKTFNRNGNNKAHREFFIK